MRFLASCPLVFAAVLGPSSAQTLLGDLGAGADSSVPSGFVPLRDRALFAAQTRATGAEVWSTDGTAAGTRVLDLLPGTGSGLLRTELFALGDVVLFSGTDGAHTGLFATDGTFAGTRALDNLPLASGQWSNRVAVVDGVGYLVAWDGAGTCTLYRTDGTRAGSSPLRSMAGNWSSEIVTAGGAVFFSVLGASNELWRSDGSTAGTIRLTAAAASWPAGLTAIGVRVFFREQSGALTTPLWVSDGSVTGTVAIPTFTPAYVLSIADRDGTAIVLAAPIGGAVDLWRSDGSAAGTSTYARLVADSGAPIPAFGIGYAVAADDTVYVQLGDWQPTALLWRTDGTAAGTSQFWPQGVRLRIYHGITPVGNRVVFGSVFGAAGEEPWVTDGTAGGTHLLADIAPGSAGSRPLGFTLLAGLAVGPSALFSADDGVHGIEPWIAPASALQLAALRDVRPGCAAAGPPPRLQARGGAPVVGNTAFALHVRSVHARAPVAVALHTQIATALLGCTTLLPPLVALPATTDAGGTATLAMPVPADATLIGSRVFAQPLLAVAQGRLLGLIDLGAIAALVVGG